MPYARRAPRRRQVRRRPGRRPMAARRAGPKRRFTRVPRAPGFAAAGDGNPSNLTILNRFHQKPTRFVETERAQGVYQAATTVTLTDLITFDPSGTTANSNPFRVTGVANYGGMDNWAQYSAIYDFYKVNKITIRCWLDTNGVNLFNQCYELYWRHDYDFTSTAGSTTWINDYERVKRFRFTADNPEVTFSIVPKVQTVVYNMTATTIATQSYAPKKMGWTDVTAPATIWGLRVHIPDIVASIDVYFDVTYDVSFKNKQ